MAVFGFFVLMASELVSARCDGAQRLWTSRRLPTGRDPGLISAGWCAVNTWIVLDLVLALIGKLGYHVERT